MVVLTQVMINRSIWKQYFFFVTDLPASEKIDLTGFRFRESKD